MLTSFYGVGFYSYMVHGVWRYLKNIDEVLVHVFYLSKLGDFGQLQQFNFKKISLWKILILLG